MKSLREYAAANNRRGNTKKGNAFEEAIAQQLRENGWIVDVTQLNRTVRHGRWITNKGDFFGAFDLIAVKAASSTLFIQATTARSGASGKRANIDALFPCHARGREIMVVTLSADGTEYEIHRKTTFGWAPPFNSKTVDIGWGID